MILFDRIRWKDPISSGLLEPLITACTPAGVPVCGALRVAGAAVGYPITGYVARLTPELAIKNKQWLNQLELEPPEMATFSQSEASVESFGWQWTWNSEMRSEKDLRFRVAERFGLSPEFFRNKLVLLWIRNNHFVNFPAS